MRKLRAAGISIVFQEPMTSLSPVHTVVPVDVFVPGCPPPADTIYYVLTELLAGRMPHIEQMTRFGK